MENLFWSKHMTKCRRSSTTFISHHCDLICPGCQTCLPWSEMFPDNDRMMFVYALDHMMSGQQYHVFEFQKYDESLLQNI